MEVLEYNRPINIPSLMLNYMARVSDQEQGTHALLYGFLLTRVFEHFKVPLRGPKTGKKKDFLDEETLKERDCIARPLGTKSKSMITNLLEELVVVIKEKAKRKEGIDSLKEENKRLKEEKKKEK